MAKGGAPFSMGMFDILPVGLINAAAGCAPRQQPPAPVHPTTTACANGVLKSYGNPILTLDLGIADRDKQPSSTKRVFVRKGYGGKGKGKGYGGKGKGGGFGGRGRGYGGKGRA